MFKFAALTLALFSGSYLALGPGRTVYSGVSIGLPIGAAQKVTPDPGSIWSFHETVTLTPGATTAVPVLVDFDGNGVMDTEYPELRVMITDMQVTMLWARSNGSDAVPTVYLRDSGGIRWDLTPYPHSANQFSFYGFESSTHLSTPLPLPAASDLNIDLTNVGTNAVGRELRINLIGRVVNL